MSLAEAAVLADEFALTTVFVQPVRRETPISDGNKPRSPKASRRYTPATGEARACSYFHLPISLKKKDQSKKKAPSAVVLIQLGFAEKTTCHPVESFPGD